MDPIQIISLWQPWASLIAIGLKRIETRSWYTPFRGRLLIHAGQRPMGEAEFSLLCRVGFNTADAMLATSTKPGVGFPLGAVVASCALSGCVRVPGAPDTVMGYKHFTIPPTDPIELALGDYTPGRCAWLLEHVKPFKTPVPMRGFQKLFGVPAEHEAAIMEALAQI